MFLFFFLNIWQPCPRPEFIELFLLLLLLIPLMSQPSSPVRTRTQVVTLENQANLTFLEYFLPRLLRSFFPRAHLKPVSSMCPSSPVSSSPFTFLLFVLILSLLPPPCAFPLSHPSPLFLYVCLSLSLYFPSPRVSMVPRATPLSFLSLSPEYSQRLYLGATGKHTYFKINSAPTIWIELAKSPTSPGATFLVSEREVSGPPRGLCGELVNVFIHAGEVPCTRQRRQMPTPGNGALGNLSLDSAITCGRF
jgi:hypothetical protein